LDGFHEIESIMGRVSLYDIITIEIIESPRIEIYCNNKDIPKHDNLCCKATLLLKKKFHFPFGFKIFLEKNIPVGSGLGGGSSNAAFTLLGINALMNLKLTQKELYSLGACLGSDVNFFLSQNNFAFAKGRGEKITSFKGKNLSCLIIWPAIKLSTKEVYKRTKVGLTKFFNNVKILKYALKKRDIFLIKKNIFNALERGAFSICKELENIKRYLNRKGFDVRLSGSGSSFYTILEKRMPSGRKGFFSKNWQVFEVQTF
jgi:4-diphosphocytidyl-2-C-methyl-D-erythritol kinase